VKRAAALAVVVAGFAAAAFARRRHNVRLQRNLDVAKLGLQVGGTFAATAARKVFASAERRIELDHERELKTAEAIAERLGNMKGALMKLGQMASYVDEGLPAPLRDALSQLQSNAPPMSADLAAEVIERELGRAPSKLFVEWDPQPMASASIGQVHRAVVVDPATGRERAVAVKVQYPGVGEAIAADLRNVDVLGALLSHGFGGLDPHDMVTEIKERITGELDYRLEARNQTLFADHYRGHPFIHVPDVLPTLSTGRVLTTELVSGATWAEALTWDQQQRDQIGECLFRFVFRSLYGLQQFNGDPHPGNYLFHGDGRVSFLDFGLVKQFSDAETDTFLAMVRAAAYEHDTTAFRSTLERAGLLRADAPVDDEAIGEYFSQFYESVRTDATVTWSGEYASRIVRHTFDRTSPISQYATVPRAFVFIQRINLGLYALLGELHATGNYRRMAEELWPFVQGPPSTPMAVLEQPWLEGVRASSQSAGSGEAAPATSASSSFNEARTGRVNTK
jgi:predicted unusual protein kinase regulating ubiquinone biosynthesis (AarF/ABC1/UbiB family)